MCPSYEGRRAVSTVEIAEFLFQSTPLIRGATAAQGAEALRREISIHAPHTRGDQERSDEQQHKQDFNPRPSYEGRPEDALRLACVHVISIHAPHTRGDKIHVGASRCYRISIHAPHTRGDDMLGVGPMGPELFQSTPLIRGATRCDLRLHVVVPISIHAPHTRGDV